MPHFAPPTVAHVSPVYESSLPDARFPVSPLAQRLFRHYGPRLNGVSVLKIDGVYVSVETPTQTQVAAATEFYQGGHVYEVSQAVADALEAAGYPVGA